MKIATITAQTGLLCCCLLLLSFGHRAEGQAPIRFGIYSQKSSPPTIDSSNSINTIVAIQCVADPSRQRLLLRPNRTFQLEGNVFNDREMSYVKILAKGTYHIEGNRLILRQCKQIKVLPKKRLKTKIDHTVSFKILDPRTLQMASGCLYQMDVRENH